jgi:hypothetical protein
MRRIILPATLLLFVLSLFIGINVHADADQLLSRYETGDREFIRLEIGDMIVYWHQRTIDGAIVEKDQIVYQFDSSSEELLARKVQWRDDLPEHITINVLQGEAETIAGGEPLRSDLYVISPESDIFKLDSVPDNPCWIVRTNKDDEMRIAIIDAVTGGFLGYGVPPPYESFSLSGPWYEHPCEGTWEDHYRNAEYWFNAMGYPCDAKEWPTRESIQRHVQSTTSGMFYELAHGGSYYFANGCIDGSYFDFTESSDIESWIAGYPEMRFAFIGSCEGMCYTGDNSFSFEFRKGLNSNTATVGYCGMSEPYCDNCWNYSIVWQDALFSYMFQGWTVKDAFDQAQADYPACASPNNCMRFAGDENFAGPYDRVYNPDPVPTLSEWGMVILTLLLLAIGTAAIVRKRKAVLSKSLQNV